MTKQFHKENLQEKLMLVLSQTYLAHNMEKKHIFVKLKLSRLFLCQGYFSVVTLTQMRDLILPISWEAGSDDSECVQSSFGSVL